MSDLSLEQKIAAVLGEHRRAPWEFKSPETVTNPVIPFHRCTCGDRDVFIESDTDLDRHRAAVLAAVVRDEIAAQRAAFQRINAGLAEGNASDLKAWRKAVAERDEARADAKEIADAFIKEQELRVDAEIALEAERRDRRDAQAEAWDKGYEAGIDDGYDVPRDANPYDRTAEEETP